jgi:hypothetical protein
VAGIRRCYQTAGLPWPDRVVWVGSPLAGERASSSVAARIAADSSCSFAAAAPPVIRSRWLAVRDAVLSALVGGVTGAVVGAAIAVSTVVMVFTTLLLFGSFVDGFRSWLEQVSGPVALWSLALGGCIGGLGVAVTGVASAFAAPSRRPATRTGSVTVPRVEFPADLIRACVRDAVAAAVATVVSPEVAARVRAGIGVPVEETVAPVRAAIVDCVDFELWNNIGEAFFAGGPPWRDEGYAGTVDEDAQRAATEVLTGLGLDPGELDPEDFRRIGVAPVVGQHAVAEIACLLWLRDHAGLELDGDRWADAQAYADAARAGWWWPHADFVMISERPAELHVEPVAPHRLHHLHGPAIRWPDGLALSFVRGIRVPASILQREGEVEAIHHYPNSEVRRALIERMGWLTYVDRAGLRLVRTAPDPGNPPHELALYEDPDRRLGDIRIVVMTNGSPDRSGALRRYAEPVPGDIGDPVEAAAWQYQIPVETYRALQRRT